MGMGAPLTLAMPMGPTSDIWPGRFGELDCWSAYIWARARGALMAWPMSDIMI